MKYLSKFNDLIDKKLDSMSESLNTPVSIKWNENSNIIEGFFQVDDRFFKIKCVQYEHNIWTFKFYHLDDQGEFSQDLTNQNVDVLSVISTIKTAMEYLIESQNPNGIIFGALDSSEGRKKLYKRFSDQIVKDHQYQFRSKRSEGDQVFILFKNIDPQVLVLVLDEIVKDFII